MSYFNPVRKLLGRLFLVCGLLGPLPFLAAQNPADFPALYRFIQDQSPRKEGSPQEKAVLDRLETLFHSESMEVRRSDFTDSAGAHSFSSSLSVTLPGKVKDTLIVVAPLNTDGNKTNNAGIAWAAQLARLAHQKKPALTLMILFLGAERGTGSAYPLGTRQFLSDYYPDNPAAVIYLDCDRPGDLEILLDSGASMAPFWMVQGLLNNLQTFGFRARLGGTHPQIFRFDLPEKQRLDHPYFQRGFPAVILQNSRSSATAQIPEDTGGAYLAPALWEFAEQFTQGLPQDWDKHYLYFETPAGSFFISQGVYVWALIGILWALVCFFIWRSRALREDLRSVVRSIWQLPIYFFFIFLFLVLATLTANALMGLRLFESFWTYNPLAVLGLKFTLALCLYFLFFLQIRRMPLSRWPGFYSYSALLTLTFEVFASAAVELSFSFYFLWALVFASFFHFTRHRPLKLIFFALAPFWFLKAIAEIFWTNPDPVMIRLTEVSPLAGNLGLTMILFPFILMSNSFHYLRHQRQERNEKHRAQLVFLFWLLGSASIGLFILRFNPFSQDKIPLTLVETQALAENSRNLRIQSPVTWEKLTLTSASDTVVLPSGKLQLTQSLPPRPGLVAEKITREAFLDRYIWHINLKPEGTPDQIFISLTSANPLVVYQCNFPFQLDNTGHTAKISVGKNPPPDLELRLTLAQKTEAALDFLIRYTQPPQPFRLDNPRYQLQTQLDLTDQIRISP